MRAYCTYMYLTDYKIYCKKADIYYREFVLWIHASSIKKGIFSHTLIFVLCMYIWDELNRERTSQFFALSSDKKNDRFFAIFFPPNIKRACKKWGGGRNVMNKTKTQEALQIHPRMFPRAGFIWKACLQWSSGFLGCIRRAVLPFPSSQLCWVQTTQYCV